MGVLAQSGAGSFDWATEFRPFTALHWITAGLCIASIIASTVLGIHWSGTARERVLRHTWAYIVLAGQVAAQVYFLWPPIRYDIALPLHICDVAGWIAGFALLTQKRWLRIMLYYWGIGLSTQAFVTPILRGEGSGYATMYYWVFWMQHLMIVGSAIYDVAVLRFRPSWRDWAIGAAISSAYGACVFALNLLIGSNYLFIGRARPDNPTLIDHLGDWPLRVLWITVIVLGGFAVVTAVWPSAWRRPGPARTDSPKA